LTFFQAQGTGAAIVTDGARDIHFYSDGKVFTSIHNGLLPTSKEIRRILESPERPIGDTTGCGDNFVGGILASLALQKESGLYRGAFDLVDACEMAIVSGGFACFYLGGTYIEKHEGEKRAHIQHFLELYRRQLREERR